MYFGSTGFLALILSMFFLNNCRTSNTKNRIKGLDKSVVDDSKKASPPASEAIDTTSFALTSSEGDKYKRESTRYSLEVSSESSIDKRLFLAANMWCTSYMRVKYSEKLKDYKGDWKFQIHSTKLDYSMFSKENTSGQQINRNGMSMDANILLTLTLDCDEIFTRKHSSGDHVYINWKCSIPKSNFPVNDGDATNLICDARNRFFIGTFGLKSLLIGLTTDYKFNIKMTNLGTIKKFDFSNCDQKQNQRRSYFHITQGVGKKMFENDFFLNIEIDGNRLPGLQKIASNHGSYALAIEYCSEKDQQEVSFRMEALEDDIIFDDHYRSQTEPLVLRPGEVDYYVLKRTTFKGWILPFYSQDYDSRIMVEYLAAYDDKG